MFLRNGLEPGHLLVRGLVTPASALASREAAPAATSAAAGGPGRTGAEGGPSRTDGDQ
ncbi:hypothetical protein ACQP25_41280 [Microtetraspora malaysiensis]|uniref:hypothetical protein n=1 Tax=Microtetraspora malaysiensis TaxID=161358 RepID=UPI003D8F3685